MNNKAPIKIDVSKYSRIHRLEIGETALFPGKAYWRVNSARLRAEKKGLGKYALKREGAKVRVIRIG